MKAGLELLVIPKKRLGSDDHLLSRERTFPEEPHHLKEFIVPRRILELFTYSSQEIESIPNVGTVHLGGPLVDGASGATHNADT